MICSSLSQSRWGWHIHLLWLCHSGTDGISIITPVFNSFYFPWLINNCLNDSFQVEQMLAKDKRIKLINEILSGIKVLTILVQLYMSVIILLLLWVAHYMYVCFNLSGCGYLLSMSWSQSVCDNFISKINLIFSWWLQASTSLSHLCCLYCSQCCWK